jgi:hypothetical protein
MEARSNVGQNYLTIEKNKLATRAEDGSLKRRRILSLREGDTHMSAGRNSRQATAKSTTVD